MELTPRQQRAAESICSTFAPSGDGVPTPAEVGALDSLRDAIALNPRQAEIKQTLQLFGLWDTPVLTAIGGGGFKRFSSLSQEQREQVLLSWCDSRVPQRRAAFQALRKATLLMYYLSPGPDGHNPVWDSIGYPGPLGPPQNPAPKRIAPLAVNQDTTLDCDVVIVGSGAGGGTAAGVLSEAGLDVVVIEAGGYYDDADFDGAELSGVSRMYLNGGGMASHDQSVGLLAGACLGGGTTVNYSTSFKTPDDVREEWASHGIPEFLSDDYDHSMDAVYERLGVNQEHNTPSSRDHLMQKGLVQLGWHVDAMPRNVKGCDQGENCGFCGYGCRLGAKQSTVKTWLDDAHQRGARILVNTRVDTVTVTGGAARGVEARTADGHRVTVRSRAVVAACGALHTPALLKRSGLSNPNVGKHLRLHPATVVWGVFDEELKPWEGAMQALYSDEHRYLDGGYGVKYETAPVQPSIFVTFTPWRSARQHADLMQGISHTTAIGVLLRDRDGGEVRVGKDGQPVVRYRLSDYDVGHARTGLDGAAQILEAAGAQKIFSSHSQYVGYEPGGAGSREQFAREADACGWGAGRCSWASFHIMGSSRMGGSPASSACSPQGETWDVRDLIVADGSAFPSASGVNPMVSIESIAHMNARALAARLS